MVQNGTCHDIFVSCDWPNSFGFWLNYQLYLLFSMEFRTDFHIPASPSKITHKSRVFSIGSCFSTLLGEKLQERKFMVLNNPFGILYNPVPIFLLLSTSLKEARLDEGMAFEFQERFFHYLLHSSISAPQKHDLWAKVEATLLRTQEFLTRTSHLFITFGTAYIYQLKQNGKPVANCHKQPQALFNKRLLELEEMKASFKEFYEVLEKKNPEAKIILTVSPVRHTKDGIPENQLSKSLLRVLCHQLAHLYPSVSYFPSYELMMDDLRDYRFYREDMVHPTTQAEDYIWEFFKKSYMDKTTLDAIRDIDAILNSLSHKPFNPTGSVYRLFLENLIQKMERMQDEFDFSKEISELKQKLEPL